VSTQWLEIDRIGQINLGYDMPQGVSGVLWTSILLSRNIWVSPQMWWLSLLSRNHYHYIIGYQIGLH